MSGRPQYGDPQQPQHETDRRAEAALLRNEAAPRPGRLLHVNDNAGRDRDDGNDEAVVQARFDVQRKPTLGWHVGTRHDGTAECGIGRRQNCSKQDRLGDGLSREDDEVEAHAKQHDEGRLMLMRRAGSFSA